MKWSRVRFVVGAVGLTLAMLSGCATADPSGAGAESSPAPLAAREVLQLGQGASYDYDDAATGNDLADVSELVVLADLETVAADVQEVGEDPFYDSAYWRLTFRVETVVKGQAGERVDVVLPRPRVMGESSPPSPRPAEGRSVLYLYAFEPEEGMQLKGPPEGGVLYVPVTPQGFLLEVEPGRTVRVQDPEHEEAVRLEEYLPSDKPFPDVDSEG